MCVHVCEMVVVGRGGQPTSEMSRSTWPGRQAGMGGRDERVPRAGQGQCFVSQGSIAAR